MLQELGNVQSEAKRMRREAAIEQRLGGMKASFPAGKGKASAGELDYGANR
jgi:hypothetical protein